MVANSSDSEEQATCTNAGATAEEFENDVCFEVPNLSVGLKEDVEPCGATRRSHKDMDFAVVVAKSGDVADASREDGFQHIEVIRVSIASAMFTSEPNRPISGILLWPLASQINVADPLVAAKYSE
jgi:hypothetical protein